MLTIARLPSLQTLNFSTISDKERLNAESYYLSLVAQELSLHPESEASRILASHPRWSDLVEEYGEPTITREGGQHIDPRSLAARLLTLEIELSSQAARIFHRSEGEKVTLRNIPKRFNIYTLLSDVSRAYGQTSVAAGLGLSLLTEEWEDNEHGERVKRIVRLVPETRGIGVVGDV